MLLVFFFKSYTAMGNLDENIKKEKIAMALFVGSLKAQISPLC